MAKDDGYDYRSKSTAQILGMVAPSEVTLAERMEDDQLDRLLDISRGLQERMTIIRKDVLKEHPKLSHGEQTYIVLDACAGLMADWGCSMDVVNSSGMDIVSVIECAAQMLQHNFSEKQKPLYDKIGRFTH